VRPLRKNRDFVLLQLGQAFSTAGSSATPIAYPLLVLARTHSPSRAGVVGFVTANRMNGKRVMLGTVSSRETMSVFAAIAFAVAIWSTLSPSIRKAPSLAELDELSPASA